MATTKKANAEVNIDTVSPAPTYTREQVLASSKYRSCRDVLGIMLKGGEQYTAEQIISTKDEFLKRPIREKINKREE